MRESADIVALDALAWLVGNDELLPVFLGATGAGEDDLRWRTDDPVFLGSVLDFLLMDEAWVLAFCASSNRPGDAVLKARAALPGGDLPHWT